MEKKQQKITVAQLDAILSPASTIAYWQDGRPVPRRDIFDDCEVVSVEMDDNIVNGRARPCIAVYVGARIGQQEA